jgi:hypothetical protein
LLLGIVALWVVVATAVLSAFDYYRRFTRALTAKVADFDDLRERRDRPQESRRSGAGGAAL